MARTWGRKGRPWRRVQARVYAEETHCHLCRRYVDQTLANYRSAQARSVHHLVPPDVAPHLAHARENLRLTHYGCNASAGRGTHEGQGQRGFRRPGRRAGQGQRAAASPAGVWRRPHALAKPERDW